MIAVDFGIGALKQQAIDKMLKEMDEKHTGAEDVIHNWLCDQVDDKKLFEGILKEDRTIKGALQYCASQAQKQKSGNVAMIDDYTVFKWVRKYFTLDKVDMNPVKAEVKMSTDRPKKKSSKPKVEKVPVVGEQLSLLDML